MNNIGARRVDKMEIKIAYVLAFAIAIAALLSGCVSEKESLSITGTVSPAQGSGFGLESLVYYADIKIINTGNRPVEFQKIAGGFYVGKKEVQYVGGGWILPPGKSMSFASDFGSEGFFALKRKADSSGEKIKFSFKIIKDIKSLDGRTYIADVPDMSKIITANAEQKLPLDFVAQDAIS